MEPKMDPLSPDAANPAPSAAKGGTGTLIERIQFNRPTTTAEKTKKAFAAAVDRLTEARQDLKHFQALENFCRQLLGEILVPAETKFIAVLAEESRLLDAWTEKCPHRLSRKQRAQLVTVLVDQLESLVERWGRTEFQPLLDKHRPPLPPGELKRAKSFLESFFGGIPGFGTGRPSSGEAGTAEAESGHSHSQTEPEDFPGAAAWKRAGSRPKTAKQQRQEAERQRAQELLDRDLGRIFKDLAMKLHPDLEQDPKLKLQKEEMMKVLTHARDEGDYSELLRLHVEHNPGESTAKRELFSESTLKTLTKLLREKMREIQGQVAMMREINPLFAELPRVTFHLESDQRALQSIAKKHANQMSKDTVKLKQHLQRMEVDGAFFERYLNSEAADIQRQDKLADIMLSERGPFDPF